MSVDLRITFMLLVLLAVSFALFAETLTFGFMSDDFVLVHRVRTEGFFMSWGGDGSLFFRPVTVASYFTDHLLWDTNPAGYHLTNLLLHFCCALLVFLAAIEFFPDRNTALLAGFIFLLLACHSESVSWVAGRTDVLATAFGLASLVLFLKGNMLAVPLFVGALFSKESAIVMPFIWVLYARMKGLRRTAIALAGIGVSFFYLLVRVLDSNIGAEMRAAGSCLTLLSSFENLFRYSFRVFIPPLPGSFRPLLSRTPWLLPVVLTGILASAVILYRYRKGNWKKLAFHISCFVVALLPVVFMSVSLFDTRSERFLYLPGVFAVFALLQWTFTVFSRRVATLLLLVFALVQGGMLYRSNRNWKKAGELCLEIAGDCEAVPLDNYNGAYVFRNGLKEARLLLGE